MGRTHVRHTTWSVICILHLCMVRAFDVSVPAAYANFDFSTGHHFGSYVAPLHSAHSFRRRCVLLAQGATPGHLGHAWPSHSSQLEFSVAATHLELPWSCTS